MRAGRSGVHCTIAAFTAGGSLDGGGSVPSGHVVAGHPLTARFVLSSAARVSGTPHTITRPLTLVAVAAVGPPTVAGRRERSSRVAVAAFARSRAARSAAL